MTPLSKRLIIALVVSVALNLLCAGLVVGGIVRRSRIRAEAGSGRFEPGARLQRGPGLRGGRREGADGEREPRRPGGPFAGLLAGHRDEMLARRRATMDARQAVKDSLEHQPFDAAALDKALAALRTETATTQELLHKTVLDTARDGTPEAREKLAQAFGRRGPASL